MIEKSFGLVAMLAAVCLGAGCNNRSDADGIAYIGSHFNAQKIPHAQVTPDRLPSTTPLPTGAFPWAGTVSHHLLTVDIISSWFAELRRARDVALFVIVSPRHWGQGVKDISLSGLPWKTEDGTVKAALPLLDRLKHELDTDEDPTAFPFEHGIGALVPFIHRYFPKARILPIIVTESPLRIERADRLAESLRRALASEDSGRWFLIISTDFSHHGNAETTKRRRTESLRFFSSVGLDSWPHTTCDNQFGMRVLAHLAGDSDHAFASIFAYTDSYRLTGRGPEDITSYFFSFICHSMKRRR